MSRFSRYVKDNDLLVSIKEVLLAEIDKNIENKENQFAQLNVAKRDDKASYGLLVRKFGFNIYECQDVLRTMKSDRENLANLVLDFVVYAVKGADDVIHGAYSLGNERQVLDLVALLVPQKSTNWVWALGDCKFELKTDGENLFGDAENFNQRVV